MSYKLWLQVLGVVTFTSNSFNTNILRDSYPHLCCRDGCRPDDLVLLTKTQPPSEYSKASKPPAMHLLALIERVERDEIEKGRLHVTGLVNLLSGNPGATIYLGNCLCWSA